MKLPIHLHLPALLSGRTGAAIGALAVSQLAGWGASFHLPAVLGRTMAHDLGLPPEAIFGGVTLMFAITALAGPRLGRFLDAHGARAVMSVGSAALGIALLLLSQAHGLVGYVVAWLVMGVGGALALSTPAQTAIVQAAGLAGARRALTALMLITGLSSTMSWPLSAAFQDWWGWRGACIAWAVIMLAICLPLHWFCLPNAPAEGRTDAGTAPTATAMPPQRLMVTLATAFSFNVLVGSGLSLTLIGVLRAGGGSEAASLAAAALFGPSQIAARLLDLLWLGRKGALATGILAGILLPIAILLPLFFGIATPAATIAISALSFVVLYGASSGLISVARATIPLEMVGLSRYGSVQGWLAAPQNIANALAPIIFASALSHGGPHWVLIIALCCSLASLAALLTLTRTPRH